MVLGGILMIFDGDSVEDDYDDIDKIYDIIGMALWQFLWSLVKY